MSAPNVTAHRCDALSPCRGLGFALRFPRWAWRAHAVAKWERIQCRSEALRRAQELYPGGILPWERIRVRRVPNTTEATQ